MRNDGLLSEVLRLFEYIEDLGASHELLKAKLDEVIRKNRALADERQRANDLFGRALALPPTKGPGRPNRKKLSDTEVRDMREMYKYGSSQAALAEHFEVNPATVSRTVRGIYNGGRK